MTRVCPFVVLAFAALAGCGGGNTDELQVTGMLKNADGSAIDFENGMVIFESADPSQFASGPVKRDGTFALMTKKPGDGVKPGSYKVVLQLWKNYQEQTLAVPEKYGDAATTPLEATVDADHTHFDFKVER